MPLIVSVPKGTKHNLHVVGSLLKQEKPSPCHFKLLSTLLLYLQSHPPPPRRSPRALDSDLDHSPSVLLLHLWESILAKRLLGEFTSSSHYHSSPILVVFFFSLREMCLAKLQSFLLAPKKLVEQGCQPGLRTYSIKCKLHDFSFLLPNFS